MSSKNKYSPQRGCYPDLTPLQQQALDEDNDDLCLGEEDFRKKGFNDLNQHSSNDDTDDTLDADRIRQRRHGRNINRQYNTNNSSTNASSEMENDNFVDSIMDLFYSNPCPYIFLICALVVAGCLALALPWSSTTNSLRIENYNDIFQDNVKLVQENYKNQDKKLWRMVKSSVKSVLNSSNPLSPAVMMFLGSESSINTVHSLAKQLGNVTAQAFHTKFPKNVTNNYEQFYCGSLKTTTSDKAKERLDNVLNNAFHDKHVAVLFDINLLPGESSIMLHSYCDNSNAPYKNVVIILTATCGLDLIESNREWDEIGETCMRDILLAKDGLNEDKIAGLLSRIGNSVVVIVKEEKWQL